MPRRDFVSMSKSYHNCGVMMGVMAKAVGITPHPAAWEF